MAPLIISRKLLPASGHEAKSTPFRLAAPKSLGSETSASLASSSATFQPLETERAKVARETNGISEEIRDLLAGKNGLPATLRFSSGILPRGDKYVVKLDFGSTPQDFEQLSRHLVMLAVKNPIFNGTSLRRSNNGPRLDVPKAARQHVADLLAAIGVTDKSGNFKTTPAVRHQYSIFGGEVYPSLRNTVHEAGFAVGLKMHLLGTEGRQELESRARAHGVRLLFDPALRDTDYGDISVMPTAATRGESQKQLLGFLNSIGLNGALDVKSSGYPSAVRSAAQFVDAQGKADPNIIQGFNVKKHFNSSDLTTTVKVTSDANAEKVGHFLASRGLAPKVNKKSLLSPPSVSFTTGSFTKSSVRVDTLFEMGLASTQEGKPASAQNVVNPNLHKRYRLKAS
jgi:hypothetical protein